MDSSMEKSESSSFLSAECPAALLEEIVTPYSARGFLTSTGFSGVRSLLMILPPLRFFLPELPLLPLLPLLSSDAFLN